MQKSIKISLLVVLSILILVPQGNAQSILENFSLRLSTSYARIGLGDINLFYAAENKKFEDLAALNNETVTSQLEIYHWGMEWEAEFLVKLHKYFSLGMGFGFLKRGEASNLVREGEPVSRSTRSWDPDLKSQSLFLNGYFSFPVSSGLKAYTKGGIGYYSAKLKLLIREENEFNNFDFWSTELADVKNTGLGFQGGIGMEFSVVKHIGIFIEGSGRILNLNDWKGKLEYENSYGDEELLKGTVWTVDEYNNHTEKYYTGGRISEGDPSEIEFDIRNIRKSKLNLSGVGLKVGFIIRFGK